MMKQIRNLIFIISAATTPAFAAITSIDQTPMGTAAAVSALPNVMVMLDDSGSMDWDYLPDNAKNFSGKFGYNSSHCNGVYYNPSITYTPPVDSTGTTLNNSAQTSFTAAYKDGYNTAAGTVNLNTGFTGGSGSGSTGAPAYLGTAFYYTYTGAQTAGWQMNYYNSSGTFYTECSMGTVSGSAPGVPTGTQPFTLNVMSSLPPSNTITVTAASGAHITVGSSTGTTNAIGNIYVGAVASNIQIWGSTSTPAATASNGSSKTNTTIASYIARGINACTASIVAPCTVTGYSATCAGYPNCTSSLVTVTGPNSAAALLPSVSNSSGGITYTYTAFPTITATIINSIKVGGIELLSANTASAQSTTTFAQAINTGINTLPTAGYSSSVSGNVVTITGPNTASGASVVITYSNGLTTPPAGGMTATPSKFSTLSAAADLQNFANWYSYYSHRMLMMKTGLGLAFQPINSNYRVGFMTMNNNVSPDFVDIQPFVGTTVASPCAAGSGSCQKDLWYTKLYASVAANSTPLREALSHVGQLYAHKFGSITNYTATITVGGTGATAVTSVTVGGIETQNCTQQSITCAVGATTNQVAQNIANEINAPVSTDYGATVSGNVVTITGIASSVGYTPVVTNDGGGMTFVITPFAAHVTAGGSLNGVTPLDPMQYSCQQNFVILSTDGFWNGANTYDLNNASVGQQDGNEPRPMNDGGTASTMTTTQWSQSTSQQQQLQIRSDQLQTASATLQWATNMQQTVGTLQWQTKRQQTKATLQWQTKRQQTKAPLQWQTKRQQTTQTLNWQTTQQATTASLTWATTQKIAYGALQWATKQQATTATLTWATKQQQTTNTLQYSTNNGTSWHSVGANGSCIVGSQPTPSVTTCQATAGTATTYTTYASPSCSTTYIGSGSVADASGNVVTACPVSGSYGGTTSLTSGQSCIGGGNIQCGTTGSSTNYVTTYPGSCAANYNGATGTSTPDATNKVTTGCPVSGSYSSALSVGASGICNGALSNIQCTNAGSAVYTTVAAPSCTQTFNAAGTSTADGSGNVTTCSVAALSGTTTLTSGQTCAGGAVTGGGSVTCGTTGSSTNYVATYPGSCAVTYNGAAGTSTANASNQVITVCPVSGTWSTAAAIGANMTCTPSATIQCPLSGAATTSYWTSPTTTCAVTWTSATAAPSSSNASGKAVTVCPANSGTWSTAAAVGASGSCPGDGVNVQCPVGGTTTSYLATPTATCAVTYAGLGSANTADAAGNVVTVCPANSGTWSTAAAVGASGSCPGDGTNVQCPVTGAANTYLASPAATCAVTYAGTSSANTADAAGKVVTVCPANSGTWSTAAAIGANGTCPGDGTNVQCVNGGATTSYLTTYPPACSTTFNGAGTSSTADASGYVTVCSTAGSFNPTWTNTAGGGSCTTGTNVNCQYAIGGYSNAASCTTNMSSGAGAWSVVNGTSCQYATGAWSNTAACTTTISPTSPYTVGSGVECQSIPSSGCTNGVNGCSTVNTGPTLVSSCTAATASAGNQYTTTTCSQNSVGPTVSASCTPGTASSANNYTTTTCTAGAGGTPNTLADVAEYYYIHDLRDNTLGNCTGALGLDVCLDNVPVTNLDTQNQQHLTTFTLGLGARGSMVFNPNYQNLNTACTPLIDGDFCSVLKGVAAAASATPATVPATCSWQTAGTTCNWPVPSSGSINNIDDLWHAAVNGRGTYYSATDPATLASGLASTLTGISARLGNSAAATTSNPNISSANNFVFSSSFMSVDWTGEVIRESINLTTGALNCNGTPICTTIIDWSAQGQLDTLAAQGQTATVPGGGSRNIYTFNPSATTYTSDPAWLNSGLLKSFLWANMTATEQGYLNNVTGLFQYPSLSAANQTAAAGVNLLNYVRGDTTNDGTLYRARKHILGDIVDSKSAYVGQPAYSYGDINYSAFVTAQSSRTGMVYVGANDGMLHAFYSGGATITTGDGSGTEAWAYIPDLVEQNLYLLADTNYATNHHFFVDGSPIVGDICPNAPTTTCAANQWKTILVGGLNAGGAGYYALDVTNPAKPQALWEFTTANMGYSYGNPQITKLANGTWVVLVTSGYDNVPSPNGPQTTGDGMGHLYVLNANTGALIRDINTGVGSVATPSGLAHISASVANPTSDNTAQEVYGGDLLGNLWRFDINNNVGSSQTAYEAQLITTLKDPSGVVQPITTKPEVGIVSNFVVVFVGTGQFLGIGDLSSTQVETMYAIKDPLAASTTVTPSTPVYAGGPQSLKCTLLTSTNCFVQQTATLTTCPAGSPSTVCSGLAPVMTGSNTAVSFSSQNGWFINFPNTGERDNTDPVLALGTLGFSTNTPSTANSCSVGGFSYSWFLNYANGTPVSTSPTGVISTELGMHNADGSMASTAFATSPTYFTLPNGTVKDLTCLSNGTCVETTPPVGSGGGVTRRTSWRELFLQ